MTTLTQHPLSAAFPSMLGDEFQDLKDSIGLIGVQNPITLLDGMVLDGWHRYSIATEYGMDCPMVELGDDVDPIDFVKAQNIARRKLTPSQTAFACTQLYAWRPAHREKKGEVTSPLSKTNAELAVIAGTTTRTIQQAKAVHASAVSAVQAAVTTGTVSLETAAAIAKLPAPTQQAIAAGGADAMRTAAKPKVKAGHKSGTSSKTTTPIRPTKSQTDAAQLAQDAHGDVDAISMLEASEAENAELRALLDAAEADDQKAETLKWRRLADVATRRQNELMDTINAREKELQRMANWQRRIGKIVCEDDPAKIAAIVEARFCTQVANACDLSHSDESRDYQ